EQKLREPIEVAQTLVSEHRRWVEIPHLGDARARVRVEAEQRRRSERRSRRPTRVKRGKQRLATDAQGRDHPKPGDRERRHDSAGAWAGIAPGRANNTTAS